MICWVSFLRKNVSGKCDGNVSDVVLATQGRKCERRDLLQEWVLEITYERGSVTFCSLSESIRQSMEFLRLNDVLRMEHWIISQILDAPAKKSSYFIFAIIAWFTLMNNEYNVIHSQKLERGSSCVISHQTNQYNFDDKTNKDQNETFKRYSPWFHSLSFTRQSLEASPAGIFNFLCQFTIQKTHCC